MITVHQFPCLDDNYGYLIHDSASGETACIDTPDAAAYLREAGAKGWKITHIWNTHWHADHAGGNDAIREATGCKVYAPAEVEQTSMPDHVVAHGDTLNLGAHEVQVLDVSGHTNGHIAYHIPAAGLAFVGDSLFALGCGRMFEGEPQQFWDSLMRIRNLPANTTLYCAHEYTQSNARFALHADPDNSALHDYVAEINAKRERGEPTVPMMLSREIETNPFLRADNAAIKAKWGGDADHETFAALRSAKDNF